MADPNNPNTSNPHNLYDALSRDSKGNVELAVGARITNEEPVPVTLGAETITITGNVNVGTSVEVNNTASNPAIVGISAVGTSGNLTTPYLPIGGTVTANQGTSPWIVSGSVTQGNSPWVVSGSVTSNQGTSPWVVSGSVTSNQGTSPWVVSGTVNQGTSPWVVSGSVISTQGTSPWTITGSVTSNQGTSPWVVSGSVTANQGTSPWVVSGSVTQGTSPWIVSGSVTQGTSPWVVSGTVNQGTSPWVVSGSVTSNQGTSPWIVSGAVTQGTSPWVVSGTVNQGTSPWVVSGSVTSNQGTSPWVVSGTVNQGTSPWIVSGSVTQGTSPWVVSGTVNQGTSPWVVSGTVNQGTSPWVVSGSVTSNQGTSPWVVGGSVTSNQGTSPWVVSGSVTSNQGTSPWVVGGTVNVNPVPTQNTGFGESITINPSPVFHLDGVYGYDPTEMLLTQLNNATVSFDIPNSLWSVSSGTSNGGSGAMQSSRFLTYRPGEGSLFRFTASFTVSDPVNMYGVQGATQMAGPLNSGGYAFGFSGSGTSGQQGFGIAHVYGGQYETRTLTITVAPNANQNLTITLNGTAYTVPVTAGTTTQCSTQIAAYAWPAIWLVDQSDGTVTFTYNNAQPLNGTFSMTSGGNAQGTFSRVTAGVVPTTTWTYQSAWNGSPVTFDPSKLTVYQIDMVWLGAGPVRFFILDEITGNFVLVHTQYWSSQHTIPHVDNPSFRMTYRTQVIGTPSQTAVVTGASAYGMMQGSRDNIFDPHSWFSYNTSSLAASSYWNVLALRNPYVRNGKLNSNEVFVTDASISVSAADPVLLFLFKNPNLSGPLTFNSITQDFMLYSTTSTITINPTVTQPSVVLSVPLNSAAQFDLTKYVLTLSPGDTLCFVVYGDTTIKTSNISVNWTRG
jgi:hypothetical protein